MSVENMDEDLIGLELWEFKHWLRISVEENRRNAEKPKYWKQMSQTHNFNLISNVATNF